jgi:hypothetical protein
MNRPDREATPPSFKVLVETTRRIGGPSGRLVVYSTALVLYPSKPCQRLNRLTPELRQTSPNLTWVSQPFFPPWLNHAIDFRPDGVGSVIRLRFTGRARRSARDVLTAAGFDVASETSRSIFFGP